MRLWKYLHVGDVRPIREVKLPPDVETEEDLLDMLGFSDLGGTGVLFIFPSGWTRYGKREIEINVWNVDPPENTRKVMQYIFTY